MNNLLNWLIILAVIATLVLSIVALVLPCKSGFEDGQQCTKDGNPGRICDNIGCVPYTSGCCNGSQYEYSAQVCCDNKLYSNSEYYCYNCARYPGGKSGAQHPWAIDTTKPVKGICGIWNTTDDEWSLFDSPTDQQVDCQNSKYIRSGHKIDPDTGYPMPGTWTAEANPVAWECKKV